MNVEKKQFKRMKKYLIPVKLLDIIKFGIESSSDFIRLKEKQKLKITQTLISLWLFIYNEQRKDESTSTLKGYTNIHTDNLIHFRIKLDNKIFNYSNLIEFLERFDLLETNHIFSSGSFSKSYRVLTDFLELDFIEFEIDFEKIFTNIKDKKYWLKKYPDLNKQIKETYEVKINLSDYIRWINNNIGTELKPVINDGVLETRFLTKERALDYINDAIKVNLENIWFKLSDEGRFYNSTTNLSYTSLPFMQLKRRNIKEVDVKNCQPLLLCALIKNELYKKDVEAGIFYDRVAEKLNKTRDEFKVLSYKYIFFSSKNLKSGAIYDAINELYPGFIEEMNELRSKMNVARELQKVESNIFVKNISNYDFKMVLRHDAVFVFEEDFDLVKQLVIDEFKKLGLKASIK
jgi:hypothetical protein